ncbi:MAG TPA: lipid-A-disaccharide synthase N-terminal domain-containing protein [Gemmatimonadaceae bacterium]|nr:lipid-A-disaccharide synthase N-terminal domain-containing protein [Gemmatimonadaceae bacterium]
MNGLLTSRVWLVIGLAGQALFTLRFLAQWIASEKARKSTVPIAFWWLSLAGGAVLLTYAIHRRDPVFALGQGAGLFIYIRNLMLIGRQRRRSGKVAGVSSLG